MKVLFLSKCSPFKEGGAESRTKEVAREMAEMGHEVTLLCAKMDEEDPPRLEWNGVEILCVRILPDRWLKKFKYPHFFPLALANIFLMFHLRRLMRRRRFDLIREDLSPFPPSGLLAFKKFDLPRSAVVHNLPRGYRAWADYYGPLYGLFGWGMSQSLRKGRLAYDRIITPSRWFAEEMKTHPEIEKKIRHIPNGIRADLFASERAPSSPNGSYRLLSVGRFVELKGQRFLIEAVSLLRERLPHLTLTFVGEGPLKEKLKSLARERGIEDRIHFMGSIPHSEMPDVYKSSHCLVLPSLFEGSPITLLEAAASRLPLIPSDIQGHKEFAHNGSALFFEKENPADLAEKIKWAYDHPLEMKRKADDAALAIRNYSWREVALQEAALSQDPTQIP